MPDELNKTRPSCPERAGWFVGWLLVLGWELFEGLVQDGLGRRPLLLRGFGQLLVGLPGNLRFRHWFLSPLFELFKRCCVPPLAARRRIRKIGVFGKTIRSWMSSLPL
jgi:hypothetical protein